MKIAQTFANKRVFNSFFKSFWYCLFYQYLLSFLLSFSRCLASFGQMDLIKIWNNSHRNEQKQNNSLKWCEKNNEQEACTTPNTHFVCLNARNILFRSSWIFLFSSFLFFALDHSLRMFIGRPKYKHTIHDVLYLFFLLSAALFYLFLVVLYFYFF